jgi:hypothetical protein
MFRGLSKKEGGSEHFEKYFHESEGQRIARNGASPGCGQVVTSNAPANYHSTFRQPQWIGGDGSDQIKP